MRNIYQSTTRHYVFSPVDGNLVAVNFKQGNKNESYYAITDNVGSVLKLVDSGVHSKFSAEYTPFGVRTITQNELGYSFQRGFTMHEHLDEFGIINANARLYDPYLARFLSPDPLIQDVTNSQNFNRYSYCLNNPLKYTDPTGEFWFGVACIAFNAVANGFANKNSQQGFWRGAMQGTISGIATSNADSYVTGAGAISRGIQTAGLSVCSNGFNNLLNGKSFFSNGGYSAITGFCSGALEGGFMANQEGKNIWWGSDIKDGRSQWSFFYGRYKEILVDQANPYVHQQGLHNCGPACAESAGTKYDQHYYRKLFGGDPDKDGINDVALWGCFAAIEQRPFELTLCTNINTLDIDNIAFNMKYLGYQYPITLYPDTKEAHEVLLNRITKISFYKGGCLFYKYKFHIMDPDNGMYTRLSYKLIHRFFTLKAPF